MCGFVFYLFPDSWSPLAESCPPRPILFGSRSKQTVMDVHPGWLSTVIGASGCYDPSRGPAVMRAITVSSHSPLVVTVTQTLSISAVFSASSIFVLPPFFFFRSFPSQSFFFILLIYLWWKRGWGRGRPLPRIQAFVFEGYTLHLVSDAASPIKPFLSAFHSFLTLPSPCPFSSHWRLTEAAHVCPWLSLDWRGQTIVGLHLKLEEMVVGE